jgi:hypothetical protein
MANVMLAGLRTLGVDTDAFGDSTGPFDVNAGVTPTAAARG